jgi:uncharacterized iron-regulated membrane protein
MKEGFRQSMAWLHTWSGLLTGWLLLMVFAAGTATYYRHEITLWMKPELHQAGLSMPPQAEAAQRAVDTLQDKAPRSTRWFITLPSEREPGLRTSWARPPQPAASGAQAGGARRNRLESATLDPATGEVLAKARETRGGEFFYRLHFDLHYMPAVWGRWIVGFCAMFMLVAIVSGIVTHKRIFADFFTFRPRKGQRSWLDAHNASAVLALPFHLMITCTGLVTLMFLYMPWGVQAAYKGDETAFFAEVFPASGPSDPKPSGKPVPLAPVGPMVELASQRWGGAPVGRITVNHPNDAVATVSVQRQEGHDMSSSAPAVVFDGGTGEVLSSTGDTTGAAAQTRSTLYALHIANFANPLLRALFFLSGLAGCLMVATGLLLWAVKERQKYAKVLAHGGRVGFGLRLVDGLNVGAVAGVPIAIGAYFWANRLLPVAMAARPETEVQAFFGAWAVAMVAGLAWPRRRMWQVQLAVGGGLFAGVPLLNALTTSSHLGVSLPAGLWAVAGFDLVCLALGLGLFAAAWWIGRRKPSRGKPQKAAAPSRQAGPGPRHRLAEGSAGA